MEQTTPVPQPQNSEMQARWARNAQAHAEAAGKVAAQLMQRLEAMRARKSAIDGESCVLRVSVEQLPDEQVLHADPDASVEPLDGGPDCPHCQNKRFLFNARGELQACPACGVAATWRMKTMQAYSSHTGRAEQQSFDNFETSVNKRVIPALVLCRDAARDFAEGVDSWLVLHGRPGNGKSHLCAAVYHHIAGRKPVVFVTMPDLLESLKALMDVGDNHSYNHESYSDRLAKYQTAPVLILDDIGAEKRSEWSEVVLFQIVDHRYRNRMPTMFVTNLDPYDKDAFDPRIVDRWTDTGFSIVVANSASSYRQRESD